MFEKVLAAVVVLLILYVIYSVVTQERLLVGGCSWSAKGGLDCPDSERLLVGGCTYKNGKLNCPERMDVGGCTYKNGKLNCPPEHLLVGGCTYKNGKLNCPERMDVGGCSYKNGQLSCPSQGSEHYVGSTFPSGVASENFSVSDFSENPYYVQFRNMFIPAAMRPEQMRPCRPGSTLLNCMV